MDQIIIQKKKKYSDIIKTNGYLYICLFILREGLMRDIKVGSIWVDKFKTVGKYVWRMRYENPVTCKVEKTSITLTSKSKQAGNQALNLMLDKIKKKS